VPEDHLTIAPKDVSQRFDEKMHAMREQKLEKDAEVEASKLGLPFLNLKGFPIPPEALSAIPETDAKKFKVIAFLRKSRQLHVAFATPPTPEHEAFLQSVADREHLEVKPFYTSPQSFEKALALYATLPKHRLMQHGIFINGDDLKRYEEKFKDPEMLRKELPRVSLTDLITALVAGSLSTRSSDLHLEAEAEDVKVRYRIDGVLQTVATLPKETWPRLVSRIKLLAGLKLNVEKVPQDGRTTIVLPDDSIDVRVSTIPTNYGESIVMRLLMGSAKGIKLEDLGIRGKAFDVLKEQLARPNGMIVTSGPTGSGKTTTLYAFLQILNTSDVKIITLEDPIEYKINGINQSQVDASKNYGFATGLRSILRQDPDVIMVGEIRDLETAEIAIQAALTGHLVLSTIHTNSAPAAVPRFLAMGAKAFLLAPAINVIMAQRLVRRLCPTCRAEEKLDPVMWAKVRGILDAIPENSHMRIELTDTPKFLKPVGCAECHHTGYRGRIGIYEVFSMNEKIEKLILAGNVSEYDIARAAVEQGMVTMAQDGLLRAVEGVTSIAEVFSVA
jgi:type IV pilus assembly protein PilB